MRSARPCAAEGRRLPPGRRRYAGARTDLPPVRPFTASPGVPAIRVNPREHGLVHGVGLPMGTLDALHAIARNLNLGSGIDAKK